MTIPHIGIGVQGLELFHCIIDSLITVYQELRDQNTCNDDYICEPVLTIVGFDLLKMDKCLSPSALRMADEDLKRIPSKGWAEMIRKVYFEIESTYGIEKYVCGNVETVSDERKNVITNIAPGSIFNAEQVDLTAYFPMEETATFRVYALDYGGVYYMSDIFLIIE